MRLMVSTVFAVGGFAVALTAFNCLAAGDQPVPAALDFTMNSLSGKPVKLSHYEGQVVLIVNTASQCGYTPQYEPLEALYKKYHSQGLAVLGFPANEFGQQEPGTDPEIAEFCHKNYGVTFDMFSKVVVKGAGQCPLYQFLTSKETDPKFAGPIKWNFEKFLLSREGQVVARFGSGTEPDDPKVIQAIQAELAKSP